MKHNSANDADVSSQHSISPELSEVIAEILDGKRTAGDFSFCFPAVTDRCMFCNAVIALCTLANGREFYVEVEPDEKSVMRVDLAHPHSCPQARRYEYFRALENREPQE